MEYLPQHEWNIKYSKSSTCDLTSSHSLPAYVHTTSRSLLYTSHQHTVYLYHPPNKSFTKGTNESSNTPSPCHAMRSIKSESGVYLNRNVSVRFALKNVLFVSPTTHSTRGHSRLKPHNVCFLFRDELVGYVFTVLAAERHSTPALPRSAPSGCFVDCALGCPSSDAGGRLPVSSSHFRR